MHQDLLVSPLSGIVSIYHFAHDERHHISEEEDELRHPA